MLVFGGVSQHEKSVELCDEKSYERRAIRDDTRKTSTY